MTRGLVSFQNAAPHSLGCREQKVVQLLVRPIKNQEIVYKNDSRILPERPSLRSGITSWSSKRYSHEQLNTMLVTDRGNWNGTKV